MDFLCGKWCKFLQLCGLLMIERAFGQLLQQGSNVVASNNIEQGFLSQPNNVVSSSSEFRNPDQWMIYHQNNDATKSQGTKEDTEKIEKVTEEPKKLSAKEFLLNLGIAVNDSYKIAMKKNRILQTAYYLTNSELWRNPITINFIPELLKDVIVQIENRNLAGRKMINKVEKPSEVPYYRSDKLTSLKPVMSDGYKASTYFIDDKVPNSEGKATINTNVESSTLTVRVVKDLWDKTEKENDNWKSGLSVKRTKTHRTHLKQVRIIPITP